MRFVDEIEIEVFGGDGGNGSAAMRREKYIPFGGPAGGDGGGGGDVVLIADTRRNTLYELTRRHFIRAERGEHGRGKDQYGKRGRDVEVRVPVGTRVFDSKSDELLADLTEPDQKFCAARGGRGGRGNIHFATPWDRAPKRFEPGEPGEQRKLRLELNLLADVGLVGYPNVGKSTLISVVSRARPKIADYPFTTLSPNLGLVALDEERTFVIADIPGIVEGASEGVGLGLQFLKHVKRTRVLLYMISVDAAPERAPVRDLEVLEREVERYDAGLRERPSLVALTKCDLPDVREMIPSVRRAVAKRGLELFPISSATGEGVHELLLALEERVNQSRAASTTAPE